MIRFITISVLSCILFAVLDGLINANPYARELMECYKPISKSKVSIATGVVIDLFYGFMMYGIFLIMFNCLPGENQFAKGLVYGLMIWFFRVLMSVASTYMMYQIPVKTMIYTLLTGFLEMVAIGSFYGLMTKSMQ
jgi:hypothetical protein